MRGGRVPARWTPPRESGEAAGPQAGVSLHGDEVEIELDGGRNPRTVRVPGNPSSPRTAANSGRSRRGSISGRTASRSGCASGAK